MHFQRTLVRDATDTETGEGTRPIVGSQQDLLIPRRLLAAGVVALVAASAAVAAAVSGSLGSQAARAPAVSVAAALGFGCSNWDKILLANLTLKDEAECVAACQKSTGCAQVNYQIKDCSGIGEGLGVGACYLYRAGCAKEPNPCWNLLDSSKLKYVSHEGTGCENWQDIQVGLFQGQTPESCEALCDKEDDCTDYNFQSGDVGSCVGERFAEPGACYLFKAGCVMEQSGCWELGTKPRQSFVPDSKRGIPGFPDQVRIALAHAEIEASGTSQALDKACRLVADAAKGGVGLLAFPEAWLPVPVELSELKALQSCAKSQKVNVVMPIAEKDGQQVYSTAVFISSKGAIVSTHRKHLTSPSLSAWWANGAGDDYEAVDMPGVGKVCACLGEENYLMLARYTLMSLGCEFFLALTQESAPSDNDVFSRQVSTIARQTRTVTMGVGPLLSAASCRKLAGAGGPWAGVCGSLGAGKWLLDGGSSIVGPANFFPDPAIHGLDSDAATKSPNNGCDILPASPCTTRCDEFLVVRNATRDEILASKLYQDQVGNYLRSDIWRVTWHDRGGMGKAKSECESDPARKVVVGPGPLPGADEEVKIAFGQFESKTFDKVAGIQAICDFVRAAGRAGADLVTFAEVQVPGYPWFHYWTHTFDVADNNELFRTYTENAPQVGSGDLDPLFQCAREADVNVVLPFAERDNLGSQAVIMNSVIFVDRKGNLLARHRKNLPSHTERLWWGNGDGTDYVVVDMPGVGRVCSLLCWETYLAIARYTLVQKGCEFLMMNTGDFDGLWDNHVSAAARESGVYTISVGPMVAPEGDLMKKYASSELPKLSSSFPWYEGFKSDFHKIWGSKTAWFTDGAGQIAKPNGEYLVSPTHLNLPGAVANAKNGCKQPWDTTGGEHCQFIEVPGYKQDEEFVVIATATRGEVQKQRGSEDHAGNELCDDTWSVSWVNEPRGMIFRDSFGEPRWAPNGLPELVGK